MAIYDCFVFYNEYDLLNIRLSLYYDYVDYFVISECSKTQQGKSKNFNFEKNIQLFEKYKDKIIYLKANDPPKIKNDDDQWLIEYYQRNFIMNGLKNCSPDDIIFLSDIDEFWNPEILTNKKDFKINLVDINTGIRNYLGIHKYYLLNKPQLLRKQHIISFLDFSPLSLQQDFFYYFFDFEWEKRWYGTIVFKYKNLNSLQELRNNRNRYPFIKSRTKKVGWHFSYLGGKEKIKDKLSAIVEGSLCNVENIDEWIDYCLKNHKDIFNRNNDTLNLVNLNSIGFPGIEELKIQYPSFFLN